MDDKNDEIYLVTNLKILWVQELYFFKLYKDKQLQQLYFYTSLVLSCRFANVSQSKFMILSSTIISLYCKSV